MNTFSTLQALILEDLHTLQQLQKRWWLSISMTRTVKEEHLGRCCYLAEELLSPADLSTLKHELGLEEGQWRAYKEKLSSQ